MRNVIDLQTKPGSFLIEKIHLDAEPRDNIPAVLRGLQLIYCDVKTREKLFELLDAHFRSSAESLSIRL